MAIAEDNKLRVWTDIRTGETVKAMAAGVPCKLIDGTPVRRGDFVVEDAAGVRTVYTPSDFKQYYYIPPPVKHIESREKNAWEKPGIVEPKEPAATTAFALGAFDRHDPKSIEKAWLEVEAAVQILAKRTLQLQPLNGASRESAQASLRLREAAFWLSQRKQIVPSTVEEIKAAVS